MSLPIPNLDDISFDDLMEEAKALIPVYAKEWTNYNPSDPGITLLELFSWLSELVIYRINQVPEVNYGKFLKLLGVDSQTIGSGKISCKSKEGNVVKGDKTIFTKELKIGDLIALPSQIRRITTINSDTLLTIDSAFDSDVPAGTEFTYLSVGSGTISSKGKAVTGDGTCFFRELKIGSSITLIGSLGTEGQKRRIMTIDSDNSLTVDSIFDPELFSGTEFYYSYKSIDAGICEGLEAISRRYRAITKEDYEYLAMECMENLQKGLAGRVICVNNRDLKYRRRDDNLQPGYISIIIIPRCNKNPVYCKNGLPTDDLKKRIKDFLDTRKLVTTRLRVIGPDYKKVKLEVWISLKENVLNETTRTNIKDEIRKSIKAYFDPIKGGQDGKGWPLGRDVYRSEIFKLLEGIEGVDHGVNVKIKDSDQNLKVEKYQLVLLDPDPIVNIQ